MKERLSHFVSQLWLRLPRWLLWGILLTITLLWLATLTWFPLRKYLSHDSVFILLILSILAIGASLAVVNLGDLKKSWIQWLQVAAAVTVLPVMFAACKLIGKLPHSEQVSALVNSFAKRLGLSSFDAQWSLFLLFVVMFGVSMCWIFQISSWFARESDREMDEFRDALRQRMEKLGKALDWGVTASDASGRGSRRFTPLEAQVEQQGKQTKKHTKRYDDLLSCLKNWRNRRGGKVFLLKGDPGSGKSVALRKLSVDLLGESAKSIPVYLNLKDWKYGWDKGWSREEKQEKFRAFALETLQQELEGKAARDFMKDRFPALMDTGRVYFLLDSFDELPCLLGQDADRGLIPDISAALHQFLTDTGAGGVVASREYRSPAREMEAEITLEIQDFDERRIRTMLKQYLPNSEKAVWNGLKDREDLLSLCRNPFHLTLLINYIPANGVSLPKNQMELYKGFLNQQIKAVHGDREKETVLAELTNWAKELADFLQNRNQYECFFSDLYPFHKGQKQALELLEKIRVCRFGNGTRGKTVTFIHRRFQEYFLVLKMQEKREADSDEIKETITGYTKNRDACVLYCGVAEREDAEKIAAFCWDTIRIELFQSKKRDMERLVNTLLFMADAFRNRREVIMPSPENLETALSWALKKEKDIIVQFALVNAMVLFSQEALQKSVLLVFKKQEPLLNNVVMKNFRLLFDLKPKITAAFCRYFRGMELSIFLRRFWSTRFALSISNHFRFVRRYHDILLVQFIINCCAGVLSFFTILLYVLSVLFGWNNPGLDFSNNQRVSWFIASADTFSIFITICYFAYCTRRMNLRQHSNLADVILGAGNDILIAGNYLLNINLALSDAIAKRLSLLCMLSYLPSCLVFLEMLTELPRILLELRLGWTIFLKKIGKLLIIFVIAVVFTIPVVGVYILLLSIVFKSPLWFQIPFILLYSVFLFGIVSEILHKTHNSIKILIAELRDHRWNAWQSKVIVTSQSIDRKEIAENLRDALKTKSGCVEYVKLLTERRVQLQGEWPEGWPRAFFPNGMGKKLASSLSLLEYGNTPAGRRIT